jgi:frataxin-like iron-binding protein CyaY
MGPDDFAALARALWHRAPPERGDLAQWGGDLPPFLAADPGLQDVPYLSDVARVDLAVHLAEMAADAALDPASLQLLAGVDAEGLRLTLAPGATLIESAHPVAAIWLAHRQTGEQRFAAVRSAFAAGQGDAAFVWREGWRGAVVALDPDTAAFHRALLGGATLGAALDAAPGLDFEAWLTLALQRQWLACVVSDEPSADTAPAPTAPSPETP